MNSKQSYPWSSVVFWLLFAATVSGCRSVKSERDLKAQEIVKSSNELYRSYLTSDLDHARQNLLALAQIGETNKILVPYGQAAHLTWDYSRLFTLEQRAGNSKLADLYFEKAKYWRIKRAELSGETDVQIAEVLDTFTKNRAIDDVDKWDKGETGDKGPKYLGELGAHIK